MEKSADERACFPGTIDEKERVEILQTLKEHPDWHFYGGSYYTPAGPELFRAVIELNEKERAERKKGRN